MLCVKLLRLVVTIVFFLQLFLQYRGGLNLQFGQINVRWSWKVFCFFSSISICFTDENTIFHFYFLLSGSFWGIPSIHNFIWDSGGLSMLTP